MRLTLYIQRCLCVASTLLLAACSSLLGPQEVRFSSGQLQQAIARKLVGNHEIFSIVTAKVSDLQVELLPEKNRIITRFTTDLQEPTGLYNLRGRIGLSGMLRFDAASQSIKLTEPELVNLDWQDGNQKFAEKLGGERGQKLIQRLTNLLGKELLDITLYQIKPDDLKRMGTEFVPSNFTVQADGVLITLVPKR